MSLVGRHIGRYRILEQLGSGGMSVVYKGLDTALDREVAVKVLHPHLAGRAESRQRLAREARAVARLHHPNILEVFDFSASDAQDAFLVTEYIRGRTLREFLDESGPLAPPELAALVLHEIAAALAHAHEAGVIHRDLKPENVMVREDGVLKLMDFGIARVLDTDERMTVTGALVGSPAHMAPEIIEGLEAGPEADVFSLGTMFYAFLTGRLPFTSSNTTATLKRILDGIYEDPRQRVPTLSDELAAICASCLAREPSRRYPNAARLRDALADYLAGLGLSHPSEEVASFFADPDAYRKLLRHRLVAVLLERCEHLVAENRVPKALASLDRVLALDATNARALELLRGLERARRRERLRALVLRLGVGLVVPAVLGAGAWWLWPTHVPSTPASGPVAIPDASATGQVTKPRPPHTPAFERALSPSVQPAREELPGERSTPDKRTPPRLESPPPRHLAVPVTILVRPYGAIRVDGGPPSAQALAQHALQSSSGMHTVTISCEYCEDVEERILVQPGLENVFHLRAQLKPSALSFDWQPSEATVRVGAEQRTARDSVQRPFDIRSPRGPASFQHRVEFEVTHPGYRTEKRTVLLEPGKPTVLRGALVAE